LCAVGTRTPNEAQKPHNNNNQKPGADFLRFELSHKSLSKATRLFNLFEQAEFYPRPTPIPCTFK
jgi:hypothetical protein